MKDLIIVGAGGMGRTMYDFARESLGYETDFLIKGYLDDNIHSLDGFKNYPPLLGRISDYQPKENDVFICSIGGESRRNLMLEIINLGGEFIPLIHKTARIGTNAFLGKGNMVGAFTTIASDAHIGDYNFIQSYTILGHDVVIGDWNRIDSHVMLVGGTFVGNHNIIHTHAMINHTVHVGDECKIAACSFIIKDVENGSTMFGNPARRLK